MIHASHGARRQGQPLAFLAILLSGWVLLRALFWTSPFVGGDLVVAANAVEPFVSRSASPGPSIASPATRFIEDRPTTSEPGWYPAKPLEFIPERPLAAPVWPDGPLRSETTEQTVTPTITTAASHNILWMAAMSHVPVPREVAVIFESRGPVRGDATKVSAMEKKRFSGDGWLLLRDGGTALTATGARLPSYGRSQAGGVLRYHLAPGSVRDPQAYARASAALVDDDEVEVALGLNARPLAGLPFRAHAEARVTRQSGRTEIRPSAFVTTGFENARLPLGFAARGYGQAGYVGGDFHTPFADGFIVADRSLARFDLAHVKAGAGVWGGAQKGASRIDVGPSANLELTIGEMPTRLSLDYRVRVAGDARPASGAALTLSTGF